MNDDPNDRGFCLMCHLSEMLRAIGKVRAYMDMCPRCAKMTVQSQAIRFELTR